MVIEGKGHAPVSGLLTDAHSPFCLLVLGHGAGAPMTHPWMEALAEALATEGISTLRYNFQYMEAGQRRPDPVRRLLSVVASALRVGRRCADGLPLFAGGKSMGGRMTSTLIAERAQAAGAGGGSAGESLAGLVFFGFPLHPPGAVRACGGSTSRMFPVPCSSTRGRATASPASAFSAPFWSASGQGPRCTFWKAATTRSQC